MRSHARCRRRAERPHTTAATAQPTATTARIGLWIMFVPIVPVAPWPADGAPSAAFAHPELQGRGAEGEVLAHLALQVAQIRRREGLGGEQRERRRIGGALGGVEDPAA